MEVYRIAQSKYASTLNASGKEGRWNADNQYVIYTSVTRSLATLEKLVAFGGIQPVEQYKVMVIKVSERSGIDALALIDLPNDWQTVAAYHKLHEITTSWYTTNKSLLLKVPSAIIQQESNVIINTKHPAFSRQIKIVQTEDYFWDQRLF